MKFREKLIKILGGWTEDEMLVRLKEVETATKKLYSNLKVTDPAPKMKVCNGTSNLFSASVTMAKADQEIDKDGFLKECIHEDIARSIGEEMLRSGYIEYTEDAETYAETTKSLIITGRARAIKFE